MYDFVCPQFFGPVVNFINILQAALKQYSFVKKLQSQTVIREKLPKAPLYNKVASKMFDQ